MAFQLAPSWFRNRIRRDSDTELTKENRRQCEEVKRRLHEVEWGLHATERRLREVDKRLTRDETERRRKAESKRDHETRIKNGRVMILYHQTHQEAAEKIRQSGRMLRGSSGRAGGGIYFATTKAETAKKTHSKGCMIVASVCLGNVKTIPSTGDPSITFQSLTEEGFDSVLIPRSNGDEYVVYNSDQVTVVEVDEDYWNCEL